ncbi:MAG: uncharacterized protein QOI54_1212 [Actinomycetota bacterium]|nr:uncharacterized protein [Actinomycetota bacterium]
MLSPPPGPVASAEQPMSPVAVFVVLAVAVTVGAVVQGAVGLGLGLVAAPIATMVDPSLMPGVMLWLAATYPVLTLVKEGGASDWHGLGWAFAGRVPGTVAGVAVVSLVSARLLGLLVGLVVLVAVVLTWRVVTLPMRRGVLVGAGLVSGVTGTATSIGGPPLALVYQHETGARLRATMATYFLVGALLSLAGLALVGKGDAHAAGYAVALVPFLVLGFVLSGSVRRHVDAGRTRSAVLVVCAASATALVVRSLLG